MSTLTLGTTVMNLAGPLEKRPNFLKTVMASRIFDDRHESVSDLLQRSYAAGPGAKAYQFYRWALDINNISYVGKTHVGYDIGPDPGSDGYLRHAEVSDVIDSYVLERMNWAHVPPAATPSTIDHYYRDTDAYSLNISTGPGAYTHWALERYYNNHSSDFYTDSKPWKASYNAATNQITITAPGRFTDTFTPADYDPSAKYIYAYYDYQPNIYRVGSGAPDYDAMVPQIEAIESGYFPFLPLRVNNIMVSESCPEAYAQASKAMKKHFGVDLSEIEDKLSEHADIADIDGACIAFGVQVNTPDKSNLRYIYEFYRRLAYDQFKHDTDRNAYSAAAATYAAQVEAKRAWIAGGSVGTAPTVGTPPQTDRGRMTVRRVGAIPGGVSSNSSISLLWRFLREEMGTGLKKPDAQVGDLWWEVIPGTDGETPVNDSGGPTYGRGKYGTECRLHWQVSADMWKSMVIGGGLCRHGVFGDGYTEALLGTEITNSGDSKFIIPLNKFVLDDLGLIRASQVASQSLILMVGAFKIIPESSLLGAILFIIPVLLMVIFPQYAIAFLAKAASIGVAIGLAGTAATLIGLAVSAVAVSIIMSMAKKISIAVFGDKIGSIIGSIVGFVGSVLTIDLLSGQSLALSMATLTRPDMLLSLTKAVGDGVVEAFQAATLEVYGKIANLATETEQFSKTLQEAYAANIGYTGAVLDPTALTNSGSSFYAESPNSFLSRTLMTGSEVAELSHTMLNNFADITLTTELFLT